MTKEHSEHSEKTFFGVPASLLKNPVVTLILGLALASGAWNIIPKAEKKESSMPASSASREEIFEFKKDIALLKLESERTRDQLNRLENKMDRILDRSLSARNLSR